MRNFAFNTLISKRQCETHICMFDSDIYNLNFYRPKHCVVLLTAAHIV